MLAGSQWKIEAALGRFCRAHVPGLGASPQVLVSGLAGAEPDLPPHALHSIDWYWPTAGELGTPGPGAEILHRHRELAARREAAESACRAALAGLRRLRRRFDRLLSITQTYAVVREQQTRQFSLGWPVLRRCALQLGAERARRRATGRIEDVFFLTRAEPESALSGASLPSPETVRGRRDQWERQRRLIAPLQLGKAPALARRTYIKAIEAARTGAPAAQGALVGDPASPGRATVPVRVILDPGDFASFQPGEVLVARATAPAWTPLFAKAAAVITDGGTLAAHASLVAREYGIPAVVATRDSTTRLRNGQVVTVDGSSGVVEIHRWLRAHRHRQHWVPSHGAPDTRISPCQCSRQRSIERRSRPPSSPKGTGGLPPGKAARWAGRQAPPAAITALTGRPPHRRLRHRQAASARRGQRQLTLTLCVQLAVGSAIAVACACPAPGRPAADRGRSRRCDCRQGWSM